MRFNKIAQLIPRRQHDKDAFMLLKIEFGALCYMLSYYYQVNSVGQDLRCFRTRLWKRLLFFQRRDFRLTTTRSQSGTILLQWGA